MRRSLKRRVKSLYQGPAEKLARLYRRRLDGIHVVGITGSCGKTSAKDFTALVLSTKFTGRKSYDTTNNAYSVARTLLSTRPWDRFCVQEVGAYGPGGMDWPLAVLRPTIGVITVIGTDHYMSFRGPDGVLREKRKLVDALPADGIAVLNVDDPCLAALAAQLQVRVVGFGISDHADLRAENVAGVYPQPLSFDACSGNERVRVETRLLGRHQLPSILAAMAVGSVAGIALEDAARAIGAVAGPTSRMSRIETANGVTFIDDSYKASWWSLDAAYDFMGTARASRKWLVLGTVSDHAIRRRKLYPRLAKQALACVDQIVFVGRSAHYAPDSGGRVHSFAHVREADEFLHAELRSGDLVFVKGSNHADHLSRLVLSHLRTVTCWRENCGFSIHCRDCRLLGR